MSAATTDADLFPARCVIPEGIDAHEAHLGDLIAPRTVPEDPVTAAVQSENDDRASRALEAVQVYAAESYAGSGEVVATVLGDVVGDLRHLCDAVGMPWPDVLDSAGMHYSAKIRGVL